MRKETVRSRTSRRRTIREKKEKVQIKVAEVNRANGSEQAQGHFLKVVHKNKRELLRMKLKIVFSSALPKSSGKLISCKMSNRKVIYIKLL